MRSSGVTSTLTSGWVGRQLGDDPARSGQRAGQLVGRADRVELERVAQRGRAERHRPGRTERDDARHEPDVVDRHRLGTGVAQLVDEVLDARTVDRRHGR